MNTLQIVNINTDNLLKEGVRSNIDGLEISGDDYLKVSGWAFVEEKQTNSQKLYMSVTDNNGNIVTYSAKPLYRFDVGSIFKNDMYHQSGFETTISASELKVGDIISLYIENEGHVYESKKYIKEENDIKEYVWTSKQINIQKDKLSKEGININIENL